MLLTASCSLWNVRQALWNLAIAGSYLLGKLRRILAPTNSPALNGIILNLPIGATFGMRFFFCWLIQADGLNCSRSHITVWVFYILDPQAVGGRFVLSSNWKMVSGRLPMPPGQSLLLGEQASPISASTEQRKPLYFRSSLSPSIPLFRLGRG